MNPINVIRKQLHDHPGVTLEEDHKFICVKPRNDQGFNVSLQDEGMHFTVTYGEGWHDHFNSAQDALNCFYFGLSNNCRLKTVLAGDFPYKWTVEYNEGNEWLEDSSTNLIFFPFWRTRHHIYQQNTDISNLPV
jgi:hypothetical protein